MTVRYFIPQLPRVAGTVELPESESHHARNVMRIQLGEVVTLFDGQGNQASATIHSLSRRSVVCQAGPTEFLPRENPRHVSLAIAMPKGDRARELIERLTELGIEQVVPIHCQRSPWSVSEGAMQKWHRVVIEACKQSGRNRLMELQPPCRLSEYLCRPLDENEILWLAHPGGEASRIPPCDAIVAEPRASDTPDTRLRVRVAIGPEGGFTEEESEAAQRAGWTQVGLGERIYRIETAAVVLAIKAAGI